MSATAAIFDSQAPLGPVEAPRWSLPLPSGPALIGMRVDQYPPESTSTAMGTGNGTSPSTTSEALTEEDVERILCDPYDPAEGKWDKDFMKYWLRHGGS